MCFMTVLDNEDTQIKQAWFCYVGKPISTNWEADTK